MTVADTPPPSGDQAKPPPPARPSPSPSATLALPASLKNAGNAALAAGDPAAALAHYDAALEALCAGGELDASAAHPLTPPLAAALHANKSVAALAAGEPAAAVAAARAATAAAPAWPKAWLRLVHACGAAGDVGGAAAASRAGLAAAAAAQRAARVAGAAADAASAVAAAAALTSAMDAVALAAAAERGDYAGFDGAVLQVRPAAEGEEWLGLPAPAVAGEEEDGGGAEGGRPALPLPPPPGPAPEPAPATATTPPPRSFRSVHAALAAAADGDTVLLLPGTHAGLGASLTVTKRVLISGGGLGCAGTGTPPTRLRAATLDARGNVPALRLGRACVVHGLTIDAAGFREGVRVEPTGRCVADGGGERAAAAARTLPPTPAPLLVDCAIRASGDDGVAVLAPPRSGARPPSSPTPATGRPWAPTLLRCSVGPARRAGVRVRGRGAGVRLVRCAIADCGGPGLVVQGGGAAEVTGGTRVEACKAEGVVVTGRGARLDAADTAIARCAGPAVDVSGGATAAIGAGTDLDGPDGGGLWAWGQGTAVAVDGGRAGGARLASVATFALLVDSGAALDFGPGGAALVGGVGGDGLARVTAADPGSVVHTPPERGRWVGPPPPSGCFVFTPDPLLA